MPGTGERAYAYAKACGIIGKSFVGRRVAALGRVSRLSELDRLIFPSSSRDLPEKELLKDIEKRINARAVDAIRAVLSSFKNPPEFFVRLIRSWEYQDLKNALTALSNRENNKLLFTELGRFATINFSAWPDIEAMIRNTEFEYLLKMMNNENIFLQTELDRHYYSSLWNDLIHLGRNDRRATEHILAEEISLRNIVWAFRLRTYYQLQKKDVIPHLVDIETVMHGRKISLAADALYSLDLPLDSREAYTNWKRADFLNLENDIQYSASGWRVDPRHFQNSAARYLYRMARHSFRARPSSLDTVFCFIKIKQFEEDALTSSAEGLGMGMASGDVFSLLGVEA